MLIPRGKIVPLNERAYSSDVRVDDEQMGIILFSNVDWFCAELKGMLAVYINQHKLVRNPPCDLVVKGIPISSGMLGVNQA